MIIQLGFKRVYLAIVEIPKEDTIKQIGFQLGLIIQLGFKRVYRICIPYDSENTKGRYNKTNRLS